VHRAGLQRPEHEQIERAGQQARRLVGDSHRLSMGVFRNRARSVNRRLGDDQIRYLAHV
jgi:hypothetical protein